MAIIALITRISVAQTRINSFPVFQTENLFHCPDQPRFFTTPPDKAPAFVPEFRTTEFQSSAPPHRPIPEEYPPRHLLLRWIKCIFANTLQRPARRRTGLVALVRYNRNRIPTQSQAVHLIPKESSGSPRASPFTACNSITWSRPSPVRKQEVCAPDLQNALRLRIQQLPDLPKCAVTRSAISISPASERKAAAIHCGIPVNPRIRYDSVPVSWFNQHLTQGMIRVSLYAEVRIGRL